MRITIVTTTLCVGLLLVVAYVIGTHGGDTPVVARTGFGLGSHTDSARMQDDGGRDHWSAPGDVAGAQPRRAPQSPIESQLTPATQSTTQHGVLESKVVIPLHAAEVIGTKNQKGQDGVEVAKSIDWSRVHDFAPIPRAMPTGEALDAIDAGFSPEWFERSIGEWRAVSVARDGPVTNAAVLPMAMRIMSESKRPDDVWANEVESKLRTVAVASSVPGVELITRAFCNAQGCLIYIESEPPHVMKKMPSDRVVAELRGAWAASRGIAPRDVYITGTLNGPYDWNLIVIDRRPSPPKH